MGVEQDASPQPAIVLMITRLHSGGAERVVAALANAWAAQGRDVHVVLTGSEVVEGDEYAIAAHVMRHDLGRRTLHRRATRRYPWLKNGLLAAWDRLYRVLSGSGQAGRKLACAITRWRRRRMVTEVRAILDKLHSPILLVFTSQLFPIAYLAAQGSNTKVVSMERGDPARDGEHAEINFFRPLAYAQSVLVTANSQTAVRELARTVPYDKLVYIPNPLFESEWLYTHVGEEEREPVILMVARLIPPKNHEVLLRAFAMLPPTLAQWRLAFVGNGPLRDHLQKLAKRLGIASRVEWHGYTPKPYSHYRRASIFVLPSDFEGQSNAVLEAMSLGLPVIVSDTPTLVELVDNGERGVIVPRHDVAALAHALATLAGDPEKRRDLATVAREYAKTHDVAGVLPQWDALVERVTKMSPAQ